MKMRSIKRSPRGHYPRRQVRDLMRAVHVLELGPDAWEVRTLGERGVSRQFDSKVGAVEYAAKARPRVPVVVHHREPKQATLARITTRAGRPQVRESVIHL